MTLGDMIKEYLKDNTMTDFAKESGLSRAYAYLLIKNKNNSGGEIVPTIETVKQMTYARNVACFRGFWFWCGTKVVQAHPAQPG